MKIFLRLNKISPNMVHVLFVLMKRRKRTDVCTQKGYLNCIIGLFQRDRRMKLSTLVSAEGKTML